MKHIAARNCSDRSVDGTTQPCLGRSRRRSGHSERDFRGGSSSSSFRNQKTMAALVLGHATKDYRTQLPRRPHQQAPKSHRTKRRRRIYQKVEDKIISRRENRPTSDLWKGLRRQATSSKSDCAFQIQSTFAGTPPFFNLHLSALRLTLRFRKHIKGPSLLGPYGFTGKFG